MKLYLAAAIVASASAKKDKIDMNPKDMTDLAGGFMLGLGLSDDVGDCFEGEVGDKLNDAVNNVF